MLPVIVGVPGMWHPASCFDDVAAILRQRGYSFVGHDAPGISSGDASQMTIGSDSDALRKDVLIPLVSQGKDIILLMHSYGGLYGSNAVQGLSKLERKSAGQQGGVVGLIYVTAVTPFVGKSLMDILGVTLDKLPPHCLYEESTDRILLVHAEKYMYHDLAQGTAEKWISTTKPQAFGSINTPVSYSPLLDTYYAERSGYVLCGSDRILPLEAQKYLCGLAGITNTKLIEKASHAPFANALEDTADAIDSFSKSFAQSSLEPSDGSH